MLVLFEPTPRLKLPIPRVVILGILVMLATAL